jgi:diguanylate cyclase (GGDEF)-like protein
MKDNIKSITAFGFTALLILLSIVVYFSLQQMDIAQQQAINITQSTSAKIDAIYRMRDAIIFRSNAVRVILTTKDAFKRDELRIELSRHASDYFVARDYLTKSDLSPHEQEFLSRVSKQTQSNMHFLTGVLKEIDDGTHTGFIQSHTEQLYTGIFKASSLLGEFIELERNKTKNILDSSQTTYRKAHDIMLTIGISCILLSIFIAQIVFWRTSSKTGLLAYQASHDALTSLIARTEFEQRIQHALVSVKQFKHNHSLLVFDLDRFKIVNDSCGHKAGDRLLKELANRLQIITRERDSLARIGGDEFGILLNNCPEEAAVQKAAEIIENIEHHNFVWHGETFHISACVGVTTLTAEDTISSAMSRADQSCYLAKKRGSGEIEASSQESAEHTDALNKSLPCTLDLIKEERYELYYQPIVPSNAKSGSSVKYAEILVRGRDEKGNLLLPDSFIPAAERYGLIQNIDKWVVANTLQWLSEDSPNKQDIKLSINLSGRSICDNSLTDYIIDQFNKTKVNPRNIVFEITETAAISGFNQATQNMKRLNRLGCKFALDDFGTGLSSFTYLKNLPVDYLKIDGAFIRNIQSNHEDSSIVRLFNDVGHTLGKHTIAEYVQDKATLSTLKNIGVDFLQGYALGKPEPLATFFDKEKQVAIV